jgi:hypothetical protein
MGANTSLLTAFVSTAAAVLALLFDWKNKSFSFKLRLIGALSLLLLTTLAIDNNMINFSSNNNLRYIKDVPSSIYPYAKSEPDILFPYEIKLLQKPANHVDYRVDFTLPEKGDANVGLAFDFDKKEDLSIYKWIVLTTTFGDKGVACRLFLRDAAGNDGSVDLTESSLTTTQLFGGKKTFKIPLDQDFKGIDLSIVKSIFLVTGSQQIPGRGQHFLIVHDIEFLKE